MINNEFYDLVIKTDKQAENGSGCDVCFCSIFKSRLQGSNLKHFLDWKAENNIYTVCGSALLYLQDLGIIKILQGVANRNSGVDCNNLKIKVLHPSEGNKI